MIRKKIQQNDVQKKDIRFWKIRERFWMKKKKIKRLQLNETSKQKKLLERLKNENQKKHKI